MHVKGAKISELIATLPVLLSRKVYKLTQLLGRECHMGTAVQCSSFLCSINHVAPVLHAF